jgi:hypothetical protein
MRTLLILLILVAFSANLSAQNDFKSLDQKTYDLYIKGDYGNLKKTADLMLASGMDYYYLRMRLGLSAFKNKLYSSASEHLTRALELNSLDTISGEYIYYSYLLSGRYPDANLYLKSIPHEKKNHSLRSISQPVLTDIFAGSGIIGFDVYTFDKNKLYYEAVKNCINLNAGFETYFLDRFKATLMYTNLRKAETIFTAIDSTGKNLNFFQNQVYANLTGYLFPGWEFSGFGHWAFFTETLPVVRPRFIGATTTTKTEFVAGFGITKNGWKIRTGAYFSASNFSNSNQIRGEVNLTYLPYSNLNFYLTSGGMYQTDNRWGNTYQVSEEAGLKITGSVWLESGIVIGNSFLYARNQGYLMNNSLMVPATTIYANLTIYPGKKIKITFSPFYSKNNNYSWNLNDYTRSNELNPRSFGVLIKLNYNNK